MTRSPHGLVQCAGQAVLLVECWNHHCERLRGCTEHGCDRNLRMLAA